MSYRQLTHGVIGTTPRACRPYRAKTKGKVERMVRETKESMLPWLTGQVLPSEPTLADYDQLGRIWIEEIVLPRRQRTTKRVVSDAWSVGRSCTRPVRTAKATDSEDQPNRTSAPGQILWMPIVPIVDLLGDDATRGTGSGGRRRFRFQRNGSAVQNNASNGER